MSEEQKIDLEQVVSEDRNQQKNRRTFVLYIIGMFFVALCLILLSYIMQQHANDQLAELDSQLTEQTDAAKGAKARADQLQTQLDSMQEKLDEQGKQIDSLTQQTETQKVALEACNQLFELEQLMREDNTEEAGQLVDEMDTAYSRDTLVDPEKQPLTDTAAERYQSICDTLGK